VLKKKKKERKESKSKAGSKNRSTVVQANVGKKQDPISKLTRAKWAGGIAQAIQHLLSKH
jgi:hypothetical protein